MTRLAVFDCDGTLIDSAASICRAMDTAFARAALDPPCSMAVRRIVGLSLVEAAAVLLPDGDDTLHRTVAAHYKTAFQAMRADGHIDEPLFDGIADVLRRLAGDGWLLGVATGKSDRGLSLALVQNGIAGHFITLQTADRHPSKPHPSMLDAAMAEAGVGADRTVVIGDTSYDMLMAANGGARSVGVAWGYHPAAELVAAGALAVAAHPSALVELLEAA